jgi:hypothetical protein
VSSKRFDVLTAVKTSMLVFWVVTPCGLVGRYKRLGETYCTWVLKTETWCFSETSVRTYKSAQRYSPEDQHRQQATVTVRYWHQLQTVRTAVSWSGTGCVCGQRQWYNWPAEGPYKDAVVIAFTRLPRWFCVCKITDLHAVHLQLQHKNQIVTCHGVKCLWHHYVADAGPGRYVGASGRVTIWRPSVNWHHISDLFQWCFSAPYRLAPRAAGRLARPLIRPSADATAVFLGWSSYYWCRVFLTYSLLGSRRCIITNFLRKFPVLYLQGLWAASWHWSQAHYVTPRCCTG